MPALFFHGILPAVLISLALAVIAAVGLAIFDARLGGRLAGRSARPPVSRRREEHEPAKKAA